MAAKHARHDMRKDKNFKGSDPSELTAQSLYCGSRGTSQHDDNALTDGKVINAENMWVEAVQTELHE